MKNRDSSVYEETWDNGQLVGKPKLISKPQVDPAKMKHHHQRQTSGTIVNKCKMQHKKPKLRQDELSFNAHMDVTQYMNEKLLNKNSMI